MRHVRAALLRIAALFRKQQLDRDLSDELESHLALHIEDNLRAGMPPEEARRQALIKLGGVEPAKELYRDQRGLPRLEILWKDLRYSFRVLAKNPGFALVAVATLALAIAANTAIFTIVSAVLIRRPPIPDPGHVMVIAGASRLQPNSLSPVSAPDFLDWRAQNHVFESIAATAGGDFNLTGGPGPERVSGMLVTADYFRVLQVTASMGRTFLPGEDRPGHGNVVILSHQLWQSRFHSDAGVVGQTILMNGQRCTIVGVVPEKLRMMDLDASLWTPLVFTPEQLGPKGREMRLAYIFARLKPGVTSSQAQAEISTIAKRSEQITRSKHPDFFPRVLTLQEFVILDANVRPALLVLMGAVLFVLLIACSNIANLLVARNSARQREFTIRAAIGAGRPQLLRQLLTESILLSLAGGGTGFVLAVWSTRLLRSRLNWNDYALQMASQMTLDGPVMAFCLCISLVAALLFGLLPALEGSKLDLSVALTETGRGSSGGRRRRRIRNALVVAEIALSIVLLTGAGILMQAVVAETRQDLGFDPRQVLTVKVRTSGAAYEKPQDQAAFFLRAMDEVGRLPGVESVSATSALPITASAGRVECRTDAQPGAGKDGKLRARYYVAGPGYFQAMRIPILAGRGFLVTDSSEAPPVAVINQALAQRFFPRGNPVGRRILIESNPAVRENWARIVGVSGAVRDFFGQAVLEPQIYVSFLQAPQEAMILLARTKTDAASLSPLLRQAIWSVDKDQPITGIQTMSKVVGDAGAGDLLMAWLMGGFAGVALVLAAVGIFGVVAYNVAQRTREVGIRMALGARKSDVLRLVVGHSAMLSGIGVGLGLLGAFPLPGLLGSVFTGMPAQGPLMLIVVAVLVAAVAIAASYFPARRAARVEPVTALRYE